MKNILYILFLFVSISSIAQKDDFDSGIKLYDTSEELVALRKTSITIGKCCQLGKAMSRLSGGMSDVYLVQSELNEDQSYTIFFVSMFMIGFDTELTQFGLENPTSKISSFHLADESKFNRLQELMINGYKEFKAHPILKKIKYACYFWT